MQRERNILFGLIALKKTKASVEAVRQETQAAATQDDLGARMVEAGLLTENDRSLVESLVEDALAQHQGDPGATIASLSQDPDWAKTLSDSMLIEEEGIQTIATGGMESDENAATLMTDPSSATVLSSQSPDGVMPGQEIPAVREHQGRYEELREFGAGGMGKILLVHDTHLGREVALKTLLPDRTPGGTRHTGTPTLEMLTVPIIARFLQEARVTGQLEHPSIVPVYELGYREDGSLYYTMKLVRGRTLQDVIKESPAFEDRIGLLTRFLDLCNAIAYAHSRHVIHRDIKPLNIMIGEFGETVVIDWGIAKVQGEQDIHAGDLQRSVQTLRIGETEATAKTMYGQTIGSPYFMPPEQAAGRADAIDERSDVYALGAVLYTILSGKPPYSDSKVKKFLEKVQSFPPRPIRDLEEKVPPELAAICERAMEREPEKRYDSAKALAEEIERYISGGLVSAYDYNITELMKRFVRKHAKLLAVAAVALVAIIAFSAYYHIRVTQERNEAQRQREIAVMERDKAAIAEQEAVAARDVAQQERARARNELYFANIALSPTSIREQQMAQARRLLEESPPEYRDWEWGHLWAECHADEKTLERGGLFTAFGPANALLTGSANGTLLRTDWPGTAISHSYVEKAGFGYACAADAAGKRLAVSGAKRLEVWEVATGKSIFHYDESGPAVRPNHVLLSANGARAAAWHSDKLVRVWDLETGASIYETKVRQAKGLCLRLSASGHYFLLARSEFGDSGWEQKATLIDLESGTVLGESLLQDPNSVHAAIFSPDERYLALGTDEALEVWKLEGWEQAFTKALRFGHPKILAFSPDSQRIVAGSRDGVLGLWGISNGEGVVIPKAHLEAVRALAFSPDGQQVATVSFDRTAKIWQAPDLKAFRTLRGHDQSLLSMAWNEDGSLLATGSFDGCTKIWDMKNELAGLQFAAAAAHPQSKRLAGALGTELGLWDINNGYRISTLSGHSAAARSIVFSPDGGTLASLAYENQQDVIRLWDIAAASEELRIDAGARIKSMLLNQDATLLAVRAGSMLKLYETQTGSLSWQLENVQAALFSPDGAHLLSSVIDTEQANHYAIQWRKAGTGDLESAISVQSRFSTTLALEPGGKRAFIGVDIENEQGRSEGLVHSWTPGEKSFGPALQGHTSQITCFAFSSDGALIATGAKDTTIRIWKSEELSEAGILKGHADNINAIAFSPDGKRLASASLDGSFKLWESKTGRDILTVQNAALRGEGQVVQPAEVLFSPDARQLITLTGRDVLAPTVLQAAEWGTQ